MDVFESVTRATVNFTSSLCNNSCETTTEALTTVPTVQKTVFDDVLDALEIVNIVLLPTCLVVGVFGNLMTILVMNTKAFSKMASRYFLVALAASDAVLLLTQPFNKIFVIKYFGKDYRAVTEVGCKVFFWFFRTGKMTSSWFVVYLCLERFTAVQFPFRVKALFCKRNCLIGIVAVYLVIGGFNAAWTYCSKVKNRMCYPDWVDKSDPEAVTLYRNMLTAGSSLYSLIPIIILVTVTPVIIINLVRRSKERRKLTQSQGKDVDLTRATTMLIAVMVTYVLFVTPITALHNIAFYIGVNAFGDNTKRFLIFRDTSQILEQINYTINFFLYVCSSRQFRNGVATLLHFSKCAKIVRNLTSNKRANESYMKSTKTQIQQQVGKPSSEPKPTEDKNVIQQRIGDEKETIDHPKGKGHEEKEHIENLDDYTQDVDALKGDAEDTQTNHDEKKSMDDEKENTDDVKEIKEDVQEMIDNANGKIGVN